MGRILKWTGLILLAGLIMLVVVYWRFIPVIVQQSHMFMDPVIDEQAPDLPHLSGTIRVLAFSKTNGFRHYDAIPAASAMLDNLAAEEGWGLAHTENGATFNTAMLEEVDVVVLNNCTGRLFSEDQQAAFRQFVERGGGIVALHAAGDSSYEWDWWVDELIRARFVDHPITQHIQSATLHNEGFTHPVTSHVAARWQLADEWYNFEESPRERVGVLLTIDEQTYDPEKSPMGDDHPLVWWHTVGEGRVVYSALGHVPEVYSNPDYRELVKAAVVWVNPGRS